MRQLIAGVFLLFVFLAENVNASGNDTLEMELESNITVVKLEHGLKFQAHSEFGLPDNMTDLFNSTAADSEGANNSSLPVALEHARARRSNKDGETAAKKATVKTTKKVIKTTKKVTKKVTTPIKKTTKKSKVTTKKKWTTKKRTTTKKMTTTPTRRPPATQHQVPVQRYPPVQPATEPNQWNQRPDPTTTRRVFVMYEDEELEKKQPKKKNETNFDFP